MKTTIIKYKKNNIKVMSKKIIVLLAAISFFNCKAQTINLEDRVGKKQSGVYYKDVYNVLNPFEGTYLYTNGNTSFEIRLQKKVYANYNNYCHEDILIGSYKYVENGTTKVDVLNSINTIHPDGWDYYIHANFILTGNTRGCTDCSPNEKWLSGSIEDPVSGSVDHLFIRKTTVGGTEAIIIWIYHEIDFRPAGSPTPPPLSYPIGEKFTLIKQ